MVIWSNQFFSLDDSRFSSVLGGLACSKCCFLFIVDYPCKRKILPWTGNPWGLNCPIFLLYWSLCVIHYLELNRFENGINCCQDRNLKLDLVNWWKEACYGSTLGSHDSHQLAAPHISMYPTPYLVLDLNSIFFLLTWSHAINFATGFNFLKDPTWKDILIHSITL